MPTMNVSLTQKMVEFVDREVASGDYASASELVRDALRLFERERAEHAAKREALRRAVDEGIRDFEEGRYVEYSDSLIDEILADVLSGEKEKT